MGNCFSSKDIQDFDDSKNYKDTDPLIPKMNSFTLKPIPNIDILRNIYENKICALCEKTSTSLKKISDKNNNNISNIVFCLNCRKKLGYYSNE
jgi:hypothetical protein|tara:strand:+ start:140 stop:418 length:279 start_codon:yes stop_codon:yes gene_type:complete